MATVYKRARSRFLWLRYTVNGREIRESSGTEVWSEAEKRLKQAQERANGAGLSYKEALLRFFDEIGDLKPETVRFYKVRARI